MEIVRILYLARRRGAGGRASVPWPSGPSGLRKGLYVAYTLIQGCLDHARPHGEAVAIVHEEMPQIPELISRDLSCQLPDRWEGMVPAPVWEAAIIMAAHLVSRSR
jgi:hypothetical protein